MLIELHKMLFRYVDQHPHTTAWVLSDFKWMCRPHS